MKLPRDVSGDELAKRLNVFGYEVSRQVGSHLRLTTTLAGILGDVAEHFGLSRDEVVAQVFGK